MFTFNNFKRVIALLFVLLGAVSAEAQTSVNSDNVWELIQWSDKEADDFFNVTTSKDFVTISVPSTVKGNKLNWRGANYSKTDSSRVFSIRLNKSTGCIKDGNTGLDLTYSWFEFQKNDQANSDLYHHGTIAKRSVLPKEYNEKNEFEFTYNGKNAKIINSRNFKIISSLKVTDDNDIVFTLFHTGSKEYKIVDNHDGSYTYNDIFIPDDSRAYSDLTSVLYFYLPTSNGYSIIQINNKKEKYTTSNTQFYVKKQGTGTGASWDDAMSPDAFIEKIQNCPSGSTFYVAEGDYQLSKIGESCILKNNITILGGFSNKLKEKTKITNVSKNITRFNNCNIDLIDNIVSFAGIEFNGVTVHNSESSSIKSVSFDSCSFYKSSGYNKSSHIRIEEAEIASIQNCRFEGLAIMCPSYYSPVTIYANTISIRNSSFLDINHGGCTSSYALLLQYTNGHIENCTFSGVETTALVNCIGGYMKFNNNTCVGLTVKSMSPTNEYCSPNISNGEMIGNIIENTSEIATTLSSVTKYNNIFIPRYFANPGFTNDPSANLVTGEKKNIYIKETELNNLISGSLTKTTAYNHDVYQFKPDVDRTAFLPIIRLETDRLSDNTDIRFDRTLTNLNTDQRGVKRLDNTCPGAYELSQVSKVLNDTICQGEIYKAHGFNFDTKDLKYNQYLTGTTKGKTGVDTVFNINLYVTPWRCDLDLSSLNFYVKEKGTGKGTSWKDAMSPEDFYYAIPRVKTGTTFHIAAGDYYISNAEGTSEDETKQMLVNSGIKFIGGYPADAQTQDAVSDPVENETYLRGGRFASQYPIFVITESATKNVEFQNVVLYKATVRNTSANLDSLIFNKCNFNLSESTDNVSVYSTNGSNTVVAVKNSQFFGVTNRDEFIAIKVLKGKKVDIENTDFRRYSIKKSLFDIEEADLEVKNAVISDVSCLSIVSCSNQNSQSFYNNTIVAANYTSFITEKSSATAKGTRKFIGNIIESGSDDMSSFGKNATCLYNVTNFKIGTGNNIQVSEFKGLLDGTTSMATGKFYPNYTKNGIQEYIIKLVSDSVNGTSIRFPLKETVVISDIIGQKRNNNTCAGAYEFPREEVFHLESITFGKNPECVAADKAPYITVADGVSPYTFVITTTEGEQVQMYMDASPSHHMDALADGEYVAVITDGENNVVTSEPFKVTSKYTVNAAVTKLCYGTASHIVLDYEGSVKKVELREIPGTYYDVTKIYDSKNKSVTVRHTYNGVRVTFDDGEGGTCQSFAYLQESNKLPSISDISFGNVVTTPQSCANVDNASVSITLENQTLHFSGLSLKVKLVAYDATSVDEGKDKNVSNAVTSTTEKFVIENLAPGVYKPVLLLMYDDCVVAKDVRNNKITINKIAEPDLVDKNSDPVIRCKGTTMTQEISVENYNEDLYTWTLTKDKIDITSDVDATLPGTDEKFILKGLSAGKYLFSLVDQCDQSYEVDFEITENLKKTMEIASTNSRGISCEGKSDGMLYITITNWNKGDKAVLTNLETGEETSNPYSKGGLASFDKYNLAGGKYSLVVTDLCGKEYPAYEVDLDELNKTSKFGLTLDEAASDAECNEDSRKISATVSGLENQSPYTYVLYKVDGEKDEVIDDKQKEVTDRTYTSEKLDYGKYKLVAVNNNGCEAAVTRTFTASHILTGTRLVCGENTHVELSYDGIIEGVSVKTGDKWSDIDFAEGAEKSSFDYSGIVTEVQVKESGCTTAKKLTDYDVSSDLFKGVTTKYTSTDETCYNKKDGSVSVTYSGYKGNMQIVAYAVDADGVKTASIYDEKSKSLLISDLVPGTYDIELGFSINGCEVSGQTLSVKKALVIKSVEKPTLAMDNSTSTIRCEGEKKSVLVNVTNYDKNLYSWQLTKDEEDISSSAKVSAPSGSEGSFVLGNLTAGSYVFSLVDQCDELYSKKFKITENIKKPLEFSTHHQGISCEGMADGVINFSVSNWTVNEDKYVLTNTQTKETIECPNPFYKGGTITFTLTGISSGTYSFVATDLCGTEYPAQIADFEELNKSSKFGFTLDEAASDAECNEDSRKISATVSGLENQSPYTYVLYKVDGEKDEVIDDKQKEVTDRTYTSEKLDYGKYKLVAVNNNGCEAAVTRTFTASHILTGTRLVCGENTHVELNYDGLIEGVSVKTGDKWSDIDFAEGADKSSFDCKGVVTDVRVKETGCYTVAALSDYEITGDLFDGVSATTKVEHQTCYGEDNGSIGVTYTGFSGKMNVAAYATDAKGTVTPSVYDDEQKCLVIPNLAPGSYKVVLGLSVNGCSVSNQSFPVADNLEIKALEEPKFLEDNYQVVHNQCEGGNKGRMHLEMMGWKDGIYSWSIKRATDTGEPNVNTHCGEKLANGATAFDLWTLPEGKTVFTMWDACKTVYSKIETIKAEYADPITIDMGENKAYTCADRTDGSLTFVASNWDVENKAAFKKNGEEMTEKISPVIKEDKAYFQLKNQGSGVYTLTTTDLCDRTAEKTFDFTAFSEENGLNVATDYDAEAAKCDIEKRVFRINVSGGTAPYIYTISKTDGTVIETSEATEKATYESKSLSDGLYKVTVTDKTECIAEFDEVITVSAPAELKVTPVVAGALCDEVGGSITLEVDGGTAPYTYQWSDAEGNIMAEISNKAEGLQPEQKYTAKVTDANGCSVENKDIEMTWESVTDLEISSVTTAVVGQTCYGVNNGQIKANVKANANTANMKMVAENVATGARKEGYADAVGNFLVDSLAPGNYNVYLDYNAGDCPTSNSAVKIDDVLTVTAVEAHFAIDKEYVVAEHPTCFNEPNGKVGFRIKNWNPNYNVSISRDGIVYGNNNNVTVSGNAADVTATDQLGGLHRMVVSDACGNKDSIETSLASVSAPSITEISADSVLLCNYSTTGFVELNFSSTYPQNMIVSVSGSEESIKMTADSTIKFENLTIGHYDINFKHTDDVCTDATVYSVNVKPENEFTMALDLVGDACTEQKIHTTVSGGAKPYASVVWTNADNNMAIEGAAIETLENVGAGSFFLTVVDANACEYISDTIQANLLEMSNGLGNITMSVDKADNVCYGLSEGQLIVNIDGNDSRSNLKLSVTSNEYTKDSVVSIQSGTVVFDKLPANDYKVTLTYAGGIACENGVAAISVNKTVLQPAALKVEPLTISAICEERGGSIDVIAEGGVKPYTYQWSDENGLMDNTDFSANNLPLGKYSCKVTDANNCVVETGEMDIQLAVIASLDKIKVDAKAIGQKCYGVPNGSIEADVNTTGYQFKFKMTVYNEADNIKKTRNINEDGKVVINALEPGDYKLTLDYDIDGCPSTNAATVVVEKLNIAKIMAPLAIDKDYQETVDPTCYNEPNGKTSIKVGNWSEFYTVSAFQNGTELEEPVMTVEEDGAIFTSTGLDSHVEMAIADVCGNSDTMKYDLNPLAKPEVSLVDSYTSLKCSYSTDGYLKYNIIGGHPATYKVELAAMHGEAKTFDYAETVLADNLGQDYYTFSYKSTLAGCSDHASHEVIVTVPQPIELSVAVSPLVCNEEASGEFSFLPYRGGTLGKVKYDSIQYTKNYAVEIFNKDDATIQQAFSEIQSIRISAKNQDDETLKNTLIQAIIPDEEKPDSLAAKDFPLQKFWKDDAGYMVPKAWIGYDMLPADVYYITTVDNQNCQFTDSIIIDKTPTYNTLVFNSVVFDAEAAACQSDKRRIEINVSGGWGEYAYSIADLKDVNADENQDNVDAGGVAMVDESAAGDSTYEENGVGYYRSAILEPGTYQITVTDAHGCMQTYDEDIVVKANLLLEGEVLMDKCDPTAANTIQTNVATANGYKAAAPYSFKATYEDKKIENTSQDGTFKVDSVPNTVVGIWVTDANQCEGFKSFPVPRNDSIEVLTVKKEEVIDNKCFEDLSGAVVFKLFGGNPAYTHFILDDDTLSHDDDIMLAVVNKEVTDKRIKLSDIDLKKSDMSNLFCMTNMAAGDHRLTITDSAGCAASIEFSLTQPEKLELVAGATGVCPGKRAGEAMGRIYPLAVSGGVKPYQYALDYTDTSGDVFSTNDHIDAREGEKHTLFVQDANGCMVNSEPVSVEGTFDAGSLDQRCLLSTWHGLGDVLVVTDVTNYGTLKEGVSLDSTVITFSNLPEGVTCQQMENELYLYGIPDSVSSILWYGDALYGPLWGVPSDIAAGVKSQEEYEKTKKDIDAEKKTAQTMYDAVVAKLNNKSGLSASKIIELQTDSATYADMLASIHQRERTNCTIDMVKEAFIPLVDETTAKRMTFWKMSSITKLDVTSFTYDFSMTSYLNGCTMSVDYNGLGVDLEDPNKYYVRFDQKDILDLRCAPNPVAYGEAATIYVTLGNKVGYTYRVYDFQGQIIKEATDVPADQLEQVTEEETSQVTYQSEFELEGITSPCIVTVSTGADMSSVIVLVKGGAK